MVPPCSDRISRVPPYSRIVLCITRTGLSPTKARRSRRFRLSLDYYWPGPRSLATTSGVSVDVLSSGYLDVSVHRVRLKPPILFGGLIPSFDNGNPKSRTCVRDLRIPLSKVGFPIRKSTDQSFFAAPHGLSQRSTSFIASQRQGIHQMPLSHLIALINNAHRRTPRLVSNAHSAEWFDQDVLGLGLRTSK